MAESAKSFEKSLPLRRLLARPRPRTLKLDSVIEARNRIMPPASYNVGDAFMRQEPPALHEVSENQALESYKPEATPTHKDEKEWAAHRVNWWDSSVEFQCVVRGLTQA